MSDVVKLGRVVQVATDPDGTPICPQDGLRMVSDDDGRTWECPIGKELDAAMAEGLKLLGRYTP